MYKYYWRVKITGIEHIPDYEGAILVSNHSGQFPWDGAMIMTASLNEHPAQRLVRFLHSDWYPSLPFISSLLVKMGQVVDSVENGTRLLEEGEVIGVFPEGLGSLGKGFRNRYRLGRFEETTFAKLALKTGSWIIPVSVVGAEETYISLGKSRSLARLFKVPNFPVTMRFPWFGLFGMVPLPSKWYIDFGPPIDLNEFGEGAPEDPTVIATLADRVRETIQDMVRQRLENRGSIFY
jgi:1-acyl-sn-glycerol-3-phosphate acyltransferase